MWTNRSVPSACQHLDCQEKQQFEAKIKEQEEIISILKSTVATQISIISTQVDNSLELANVNMSLQQQVDLLSSTEVKNIAIPQPNVKEEQIKPRKAVSLREKQQREEIAQMVANVEQLSCKYSPRFARYDTSHLTNNSMSRKKG